ncbi:MAG: TonB-dependent receptor [Gammaproteobacteria bacterium]|nr:TonB-dependent receptor [Gammaproteobacteria bacterium]
MKHEFRLTALAAALLTAQAASAQSALEEITVTAQRKAQSLQEAALAIDVLSSDTLAKNGVTDAYELTNLVPALTLTAGGGMSGQLYMRGIGNRANNAYLDPAIIVTYDGVVMARGAATSTTAFFDIERVEVLKGPQGTLYGKNATGGVINILPVAPKLGETSGFVNAGYGNFDNLTLSGAFNAPIGDSSALRVAGSIVNRDGYNKDGTNDSDSKSIRAQFLSEINEDLTVRIAGDYSDIGGVGNGTTPVGQFAPGGLATYTFVPSGLAPGEGTDTAAGNAYRNSILAAPGFGFLGDVQDEWYVDGKIVGINAEINYDTAIGQFTLIPAWREIKQDSMFNGPGFNSGWWQEDMKQTSVELRLAGETGSIVDYLVGGFYFTEDITGNNTFNQEFVLPLQEYKQDTTSWALFTQLTWNFSDTVRLITGARYTDDHKEMDGSIDNFITFCGGPPPGLITPPQSFTQGCQIPGNLPHFPTLDTVAQAEAFLRDNGWATVFNQVAPGVTIIPLNNGIATILHASNPNLNTYDKNKMTYRLSLEWDVADDSLVYGSFETGYRSGGFQLASVGLYQPEYLDAFTLGTKNRFLDGRLQLNAEIFYWDYKDQQISYFTLSEAGVLENLTDNVGKATSKGVDIDLLWLATDRTLLSAKVQYLDATYDDLHFVTSPPRDNINCPFNITGTNNGTPVLDFDCSNNPAIYSPKWVVKLGIEHTFDLGRYDLTASADTTWTDDQVTGFNNLAHEVINDHTRTNLGLTLSAPDNRWSVNAYIRNLEDKRRVLATQAPLLGMAMTQFGAPMTYGIGVNYNF